MENQKYASELPYPIIDVDKNIAESKMLMPSYAGSASELSHVMTYVFKATSPRDTPKSQKP